MKYYLIAGEASGDLHGANLIKGISKADPQAVIRAWGGDLMAEAGAEVVKHYRELAFMGFIEVARNLPEILRNFKFCKADVLSFSPDALILVDYPGFNLRMAKWASEHNLRVYYYISPQLWAWHTSRANIIRDHVERMFVILPFEKAFYDQFGIEVDFPGHPLLDIVDDFQPDPEFLRNNGLDTGQDIIALLPGSRKQEISKMLKVMLQVVPRFPDHQFVVGSAPSINPGFYRSYLRDFPGVHLVENKTYDLLSVASAALVTSGTATLETALFNVPQVVCYRGSTISYRLAKVLVNKDLKFIAMVNLIAGRQVVTELIQDQLNADRLHAELVELFTGKKRATILEGYREVRRKLGQKGASQRAGKMIVERMAQDNS